MNTQKEKQVQVKLGKQAPRHDVRTLQLANYLRPSQLPPIPASCDWSSPVKAWGMMDNDTIGDCTCAAAGHLIMEWTAANGKLIKPTDKEIIAAYSAITGFDPKTGHNDNGAVETDVLNYWRKKGIADHKIFAYAALEPGNHDHIKESVALFGGCYIGLALPISAQNQRVWSVPPGGAKGNGSPGSWGGHAVPVVAYDDKEITVVTWGVLKKMTWAFWDAYCDESYAVLSKDFATGKKKAPSGFDLKQLQSDLEEITH